MIIGCISNEVVQRKVSLNYVNSLLNWFCEFFKEKYENFNTIVIITNKINFVFRLILILKIINLQKT